MKYGTLVRIPEGGDIAAVCEEKFSRLETLGMEACQLVYKPAVYDLEDADIIKESAQRHNIEISAQFCGYYDSLGAWDTYFDYRIAGITSPIMGESRMKYLLSAIPFLERLGITDMIIHAGMVSNDPFSESYINMLTCVRVLGGQLKQRGMNLLFETGGEAPITMLRLIQDYGQGNLYVNLDTANLIMYGLGNPVDAIYTYGKYVRNMHAKDGLPPTDPKMIGQETSIGSGYVDFDRVIKHLSEIGYDRYMIIECELTGSDHDQEIQNALVYLKKIVEKYQKIKNNADET